MAFKIHSLEVSNSHPVEEDFGKSRVTLRVEPGSQKGEVVVFNPDSSKGRFILDHNWSPRLRAPGKLKFTINGSGRANVVVIQD